MRQLTLWDDCWNWGSNPLEKHAQSDAVFFHETHYRTLKSIVLSEWARTYSLWKRKLISANTNKEELIEVARLEIDAMERGITTVQSYIGDKIGCSPQRVGLLLKLISIDILQDEIPNFCNNYETSYVINEDAITDWYPSKKEIEAKMATIPRICAAGYVGCHQDTRNSKFALCFPCHVELLRASGKAPNWVLSEQSRIKREHYATATDACFQDHYGTMSIDELESYLDAG